MNYYSFHIGDYRRDTTHLSLLEHGTYRQLLDWFYLDEKPIPKETETVFRRLCARTEEEQNAVRIVLAEFFQLTDEGYVQSRAVREVAQYQARAKHARVIGKLGGRPQKTKEVSQKTLQVSEETKRVSFRFPEETCAKPNQEPITNNHKPGTNNQEPGEKARAGVIPGEPDETAEPKPARVIHLKPGTADSCCNAMMMQGIHGCNPHHPDLIALLEAGATEEEFSYAARDAMQKGKSNFAYVIGMVKSRREEAARLILAHGRLPNAQELLEQSNRAAIANWMPPELRKAKHAH